jgi:SAM-dependent methyltransferase
VDEPNRIVASGYDRIAETYEAWMGCRASPNTAPAYYRRFLDECLDLIPHGALVLDLGCGAGRVAAEIGKRARVVGVDISIAQIRLARQRVPTGAFLVADMAKLEFRSGSFDAIAAFYSVIHVRRDLHAGLLRSMHQWMRPEGVLFGAFGSDDNPDERGDFLGQPMYWSHFDAETTRGLLVGAGFSIVQADVVEDQGEHPLWVVATA